MRGVRPSGPLPAAPTSARDEPVASAVWRVHLPRLRRASPELAASFEKLSLRWGNRALEHFLERVVGMPKALEILVRRIELVPYIAELMEYSPHFAGYLLRFPEDAAVIAPENGSSRQDHAGEAEAGGCPMPSDVRSILDANLDPDDAAAELRKFFRRAMLAIQTRSICQGEDVFRTLLGASDLAEWILRAAHVLALREVLDVPAGQAEMSDAVRIIALGRLGMREFDLGSDADVVFVIPDKQASRRATWTQVVNRIIDIVSSYTAEGQMFSIDTRLRPLGRDGELVQTEKQFLTYLAGRAESWEALTYMKARTVGGGRGRGRGFPCPSAGSAVAALRAPRGTWVPAGSNACAHRSGARRGQAPQVGTWGLLRCRFHPHVLASVACRVVLCIAQHAAAYRDHPKDQS